MEEFKNKHRFGKGVLTGVLVSCVILTLAVWFFGLAMGSGGWRIKLYQQSNETGNTQQIEDKLSKIDSLIKNYFLFEYEDKALTEGIYKGFMSGLNDDYSVYYTEQEYTEMKQSSAGSYYGIGVQVSHDKTTGYAMVIRVFYNTPAEEAGMQAGDLIVEVAGQDVYDMDLNAVVSLIKGEEGTTVPIKVYRESINDYIAMDVERRQVETNTVEHQMLDQHIGYIELMEFDDITYSQFMEALEDLEAQGMESLILDLRDNPGGLLTSVCDIADELLPEGVIVSIKDKNGAEDVYKSDADKQFDKPLVVLINGYSASASEILAGAVKDYKLGTLVGTTTFGKGIVQNVIDLRDGTAIKITTSHYFTPNGANIHGVGIAPDIEVELSEEKDNQLEKAISLLLE